MILCLPVADFELKVTYEGSKDGQSRVWAVG